MTTVVAALLLRRALDPLLGPKLPLLTFYPAMMLSAWYGGLGPGIAATILSVAAAYLWMTPTHSLAVSDLGDAIALMLFVGIGVLTSALNQALHRARQRGRASADERERLLVLERAARAAAESLAEAATLLIRALDPDTLAHDIVHRVRTLLRCQAAVFARLEPDAGGLVVKAVSGAVGPFWRPGVGVPDGTGQMWRAIREGRPVTTANLLEDPAVQWTPEVRAGVEAAEYRAALAVPLIMEGRVLGAIGIGDHPGRVFDEDEVRLVSAFAAQAAVAVENARLYHEAERRRAEAEQQRQESDLFAELARRISESSELAAILRRIALAAEALCGADVVRIALREPGSDAMTFHPLVGARYPGYAGLRLEPGKGLAGIVRATGRPLRTADIERDPRFPKDYAWLAREEGIVTGLVVPVVVGGTVEGLIYLNNRTGRPFTDRDESMVLRLAALAGNAVTNAVLLARERAANRAKDEFLAMLGHELRNPLAAIRNAVMVLGEIGSQDEQSVRARRIVTRQTEHLTRLVDDLLDVARLDAGKIALERKPLDLRTIAEGAILSVQDQGRLRQHDVSFHGEPAPVEGDATRLEQIVVNLLDNAVKYTPAGGRIAVRVERDGEQVVLRVDDTGVGISAELLPRVFDAFVQADTSLHRTQGGLGLGLALVKRLSELHGGTVAVSSPGPGQGCEFVVRLPALGPRPVEACPVAASVPEHGGLRIVLVEDNDDAREALSFLLASWGHEVEQAADGRRGVELIAASRPDLGLIDVGLPGLDGFELARAVRATPNGASVYLVALTGYGQPEDRRRAGEAGFDAFLVKPVGEEALIRVLASVRSESEA